MRILVTGGCGFIGNHVVRNALLIPGVERVVNLDLLTYSGNLENLKDVDDSRYQFVHGSINDSALVETLLGDENISVILHLAAESHVDRSIDSVQPFIETNVDGTRVLLESIAKRTTEGVPIHFVHVSTDEVYGSLGPKDAAFTEETPLNPQNPYAASKAASDMLVQAFINTHKISAIITRCSNNYGPRQHPEKLIPLMTLNALNNKLLPVYGNGLQIRDWIHVEDHANGVLSAMLALYVGRISSGEVFNFGADNEQKNIDIVKKIISQTSSSDSLINFVKDRPGHDKRYAMKYNKAEKILGWKPEIDWNTGLLETIQWYKMNPDWVNSTK
jgi:dTDP-glucose 4,6-dehydratase